MTDWKTDTCLAGQGEGPDASAWETRVAAGNLEGTTRPERAQGWPECGLANVATIVATDTVRERRLVQSATVCRTDQERNPPGPRPAPSRQRAAPVLTAGSTDNHEAPQPHSCQAGKPCSWAWRGDSRAASHLVGLVLLSQLLETKASGVDEQSDVVWNARLLRCDKVRQAKVPAHSSN